MFAVPNTKVKKKNRVSNPRLSKQYKKLLAAKFLLKNKQNASNGNIDFGERGIDTVSHQVLPGLPESQKKKRNESTLCNFI